MKKHRFIIIFILWTGLISGFSDDNTMIRNIREEYNIINNSLDSYTKIQNMDIGIYKDISPNNYSFESEEIFRLAITNLERYYDENVLRKAIVKFDGDRQDLVSEYYYKNDSLIFVFKTKIDYKKPKWSEDFHKKEKNLSENRYYFNKGKLIKWIGSNGTTIDLISVDEKIANQILSDSKLYMQIEK